MADLADERVRLQVQLIRQESVELFLVAVVEVGLSGEAHLAKPFPAEPLSGR